jgi:hypothetical protein
MGPTLRRGGIAFGSLVTAWLIVTVIFGQGAGVFGGVVVIVLGALVYRDIIRHDT